LKARVLDSIEAIDPAAWNLLAGPHSFAQFGWLVALEIGGVTTARRGWTPAHLVLEDDEGLLLAAAPLWIRDSSYGEFVWDEPISAACERGRRPYAPRGVATIPWIPATGRKLLTHPQHPRETLLEALVAGLLQLARERGLASLNVHFCEADEARALRGHGFLERFCWQYHWHDREYGTFDGFLSALRAPRRQRIRRELRELEAQGVAITYRRGGEADFARMARLYADTWSRHEPGEPVLTREFFMELGRRCAEDVWFGIASRGDEVVGMTLNTVLGEAMFGRWWGCAEPLRFLHFNLAYHLSVQHCIEHGLRRFEPGHGGDYKRVRGFDPVLLRSVHWHADRRLHHAIEEWARDEAGWVHEQIAQKRAEGPFHRTLLA
jgi:predicted N-acyltransferase